MRSVEELDGCEERYAALLREKTQAVKAAGGAAAEQILRLEEREAYLESQERELGEASAAGQSALATADEILESLSSAEGWGTWDLIGGGLIADLASTASWMRHRRRWSTCSRSCAPSGQSWPM